MAAEVIPAKVQMSPRRRLPIEAMQAWLFLLPAVVVLGVFQIFPAIAAFYMSLFRWDVVQGSFRGLGNYTDWLYDNAIRSPYMPVRATSANSQTLKDYWARVPQGKQGFDLIQYSTPEPNIRGQQDIRDVIFNMITEVITAKSTPDAAIATATTKANQILKDLQ